MKRAIGIAAVFVAASTVAQTTFVTTECRQFLTQQHQQGADLDAMFESESVQGMADAAWAECRAAVLAQIEARRKMAEEIARRKAEHQKQKGKVGEFVEM